MGYPEKGGGRGKATKGGRGPGMGARGKYAFKVLCPDIVVTIMIGPRGSFKEQVEGQTGCKIVASNREEYFPGTRLRILVIYGPTPEAVYQVLEIVIDKVAECGAQEMLQQPKAEADFLGKSDGEYLFRATIAAKMFHSLIGPGGANVQAIRNETNAKVFVDNSPVQGHQLVKVVGTIECLRSAIWRINECIAQMAAEEPWFAEWSMIRCITEASEPPAQSHQWDGPSAHSSSTSAATNGNAGADEGSDFERLVQVIDATKKEFPEGALAEDFTISCDLPYDKVSALIGKKGANVQHVQKVTGAKVVFNKPEDDGQQTVVVKGPLLSIYQAHALLMKKYHDTEQRPEPAAAAPEPESIADLEAQLQALQKQLAATTAGRSGKKGKKGA